MPHQPPNPFKAFAGVLYGFINIMQLIKIKQICISVRKKVGRTLSVFLSAGSMPVTPERQHGAHGR